MRWLTRGVRNWDCNGKSQMSAVHQINGAFCCSETHQHVPVRRMDLNARESSLLAQQSGIDEPLLQVLDVVEGHCPWDAVQPRRVRFRTLEWHRTRCNRFRRDRLWALPSRMVQLDKHRNFAFGAFGRFGILAEQVHLLDVAGHRFLQHDVSRSL